MQRYKKSKTLLIICIVLQTINLAQAQTSITGKVTDNADQPLMGASVLIKNSTIGTMTDSEGNFELNNITIDKLVLQIQYLGFDTKDVTLLQKDITKPIDIKIKESSEGLDEIIIKGESITEKKKSDPIKIQVISTQKYKSQSASVIELINRSPGIRIRQSGGLNSTTQINLNGFQGNSIRLFKDGIPMDYLDAAYSIGIVPPNTLERVEVYKGVLPANLASDALGGALNLVSLNKDSNNISTSYQIGSFNTHRATLNASFISKDNKYFGGVEAFLNYSDNDYNVDVNYVDDETRNEVPLKTKLFHNRYKQHYIEFFIGVKNRKWADLLKLSATNFKIDNQNQFGLLMQYPIGQAYNTQEANFIPTLRYKKRFLKDKLKLDQFIAYSKITRVAVDTLNGSYDWLGNFSANLNGQEAGETGSANLTTLDKYNTISKTLLTYNLNRKNILTLNTVYNTYNQKGSDPYGEYTEGENPVQLVSLPADYNKLVVGFALDSKLWSRKAQNSFQLKYYNSKSKGLSYNVNTGLVNDDEESASISNFGIGNSIRYSFNNNSYVRLSAEQATRLPSQLDVFGNGDTILANFSLKPEQSTNVNLGIHNKDSNQLVVDFNLFYRYTKDMISTRLSEAVIYSISENLNKVRGYGLETEISYPFFKRYNLKGNITYQSFRQKGHQDDETALYDDARINNMPYFFGNLGVEANFKDIFTKKDDLKAYWNYSYVHPYFLKRIPKKLEPEGFLQLWGDPGLDSSLYIKKQNTHSAGMVWIPNQVKQFSCGLEVKNIFDQPIYDNFKIQNAGRSFHLKLAYSINFQNFN